MIQAAAIQQVKDAMRVEDVVGDFVALKRRGPRYLGLCPFHNEKTPSFTVSPNLGIFKCFGCGEAGDAIAFLQKHEHLSYLEAIRWLAKRYHIDLPEQEATPEQQQEQNERESIAVVQQWALAWSTSQLWNTDEGRRIGLSYFHERGFTDATIKTFQLGYVPEQGNAFAQAALARGFDPDVLEKAGWIKRREDGTAWDFFAGRVTFPIHSLSGQPIAFGARTLKSDTKLAKYFNSPESALYVKSRSLYGIHHARKAIVEQQLCYLVEGYTDVIALHQAGIANVVASSGTSLTEEQVRLIKRYTPKVAILYDGDPAGIRASIRGTDLLLKEDLEVKVVVLPDGEDPDSFARKRSSTEVADHLARSARDFFVFRAELAREEVQGDPFRKAALVDELLGSLSWIRNTTVLKEYRKRIADLLDVKEDALAAGLRKILVKRHRKEHAAPQEEEAGAAAGPIDPARYTPQHIEYEDHGTRHQERALLRLLLNYGDRRITTRFQQPDGSEQEEEITVAELMFELLAVDDLLFDDPLFREMYLDYRHNSNLGAAVRGDRYAAHEREDWRKEAIDLLTEKHLLSPNWAQRHRIHVKHEGEVLADALMEAVDILKERRLDRKLLGLTERLKTADYEEQKRILAEKAYWDGVKVRLAKRTGRVVVRF